MVSGREREEKEEKVVEVGGVKKGGFFFCYGKSLRVSEKRGRAKASQVTGDGAWCYSYPLPQLSSPLSVRYVDLSRSLTMDLGCRYIKYTSDILDPDNFHSFSSSSRTEIEIHHGGEIIP